MSTDGKRRLRMWGGFSTRPPPKGRPLRGRGRVENPSHMIAATAFVTLLALSVVWPSPVVSVNRLCCNAPIGIANRFGGGMNPAMVVGFFLLAGVAFRLRRWIEYAVAMTIAGLGAGILGQLVKLIAGRTRPEVWLGPFHHARIAASSFPSGH